MILMSIGIKKGIGIMRLILSAGNYWNDPINGTMDVHEWLIILTSGDTPPESRALVDTISQNQLQLINAS